jgi:pyruvate/2-oxoglutarate dehydrogenase complex dihydrolipoamide dehydrogenase (E3) component
MPIPTTRDRVDLGNLMAVVIIGALPAGLVPALGAAELGARAVLVTQGEGGGRANDGPMPVQTIEPMMDVSRDV